MVPEAILEKLEPMQYNVPYRFKKTVVLRCTNAFKTVTVYLFLPFLQRLYAHNV